MQKHDLPDQPVTEEPRDPQWTPPPPPAFEGRMWFMLIIERFGFWIACALTITVIAFLYINADQFPRKDKALSSVAAEEQGAPMEEQGRLAEALNAYAEEPDTTIVAGVPLSITTDPFNAAIFVDGNYVGVSPLRYVVLAEGRHLISVLKPDYAQLDTVVTLNEASVSLQLTLREADDVILPEASEDIPPETPTTTDEADRDETLSTPATPALEPTSTHDAAQAGQERTTPPRDAGETRPAEDPSDDKPLPVAETEEAPAADAEEAPVVQVGELQINSEPSGVSVLVAGEEVGVTPLLLSEVQVGPQQITLRLDGYQDLTTTAYVLAQQQSTVNRQLKQLLGTLKILVKPWGSIYIDGELHKKESDIWYTTKLMSGYHRVRVEHPSLGNWDQVVEVPAGEEHSITIDFNKGDSDSQ